MNKHSHDCPECGGSVRNTKAEMCRNCYLKSVTIKKPCEKCGGEVKNAHAKICRKCFVAVESETHKTCTRCGETKLLDKFQKHKGYKNGRLSWCMRCKNDVCEAKRKTRPEHEAKLRRKSLLRRTYGLTLVEYDELSKNGCNICGKIIEKDGRRLAVDHCHKTGKIRGVLCSRCNQNIGHFEEDPELLIKAAKYLMRTVSE